MDDQNNRESSWRVDDILKELGMLDDLPNTSSVPKPENNAPTAPQNKKDLDAVKVEFPEGQHTVENPSGNDGKTKVWPISSGNPPKVPFENKLFTPMEAKFEGREPSLVPAPDLPSPQTDNPIKPEDEEEELTLKQEIFEWIKAIVISFAVVFLVFGVLIKVVTVDGVSMEPTLHNNDRLVISKLFYTPEQGDIVVLSKNSGLDKALIKRVVATGGQTLDIGEDGTVYVNGLPLDEPYIKEKIAANMHGQHDYPVVVPPGHVFVMGDNRNDSTDSRFAVLSFVDEKYIMGRVLLRLYPLNKIGTVK